MTNLKGKVGIIFGATGGIGEPITIALNKAGASLTISSRTSTNLSNLHSKLEGGDIIESPGDASNPEDVLRTFRETEEKFGTLDFVLIATGTWIRTTVIDEVDKEGNIIKPASTPTEIIAAESKMYALIQRPAIVVSSIAQEIMRKKRKGKIFNTSSHVVLNHKLLTNLAYGANKDAANGFISRLNIELYGTGVQAINIIPGLVDTPENRKAFPDFTDMDWAKAVQPRDIATWIAENMDTDNISDFEFKSGLVV